MLDDGEQAELGIEGRLAAERAMDERDAANRRRRRREPSSPPPGFVRDPASPGASSDFGSSAPGTV